MRGCNRGPGMSRCGTSRLSWACAGSPSARDSRADGGATWTYLGLADTQQIGRVAIHPKNPDIVFVAAPGHLFTPNEERGLFRTKDGGKTFNLASTSVDVLYEFWGVPRAISCRCPWILAFSRSWRVS